MDPERYRQIDRILAQALERPPAERDALCAGLCGDDAELDREVRSLLAAEEAGGDFLAPFEKSGLPWAGDDDGASDGEQRAGPYRLVEIVGRGGTAAVYRAEHDGDAARRPLAVKLSRWHGGTAEALRFYREWRVLAQLDHPAIARFHDFGTTADGRLYLAMELVDGAPLERHCDERRLSVGERLALFCEICGAVDYAHRRGVIHRDLKPRNVLVTREGKVKVLDFGIAKPLSSQTLRFGPQDSTQTGFRVLTPGYASPEQVEGGKITRTSDVYSLGVMLFELLAGASPYPIESTWPLPLELAAAVTEREPLTLTEALGRLGDDPGRAAEVCRARGAADFDELRGRLGDGLEAVVARALRKAPERRYGTALSLANDVGRCLRGRPPRALLEHRLRGLVEGPARRFRRIFAAPGTR